MGIEEIDEHEIGLRAVTLLVPFLESLDDVESSGSLSTVDAGAQDFDQVLVLEMIEALVESEVGTDQRVLRECWFKSFSRLYVCPNSCTSTTGPFKGRGADSVRSVSRFAFCYTPSLNSLIGRLHGQSSTRRARHGE